MSSSYRLELDKWISNLEVKAYRVLDVGGSQLPAKGRTKSWDVGEYKIADLANPHVDSPKPDIELDLNYYHGTSEETYDYIFCLEVFDYIWNPGFAFLTLYTLLAPGGTLWVTFPSIYPLHQPIEDDALRYMPGGIKKLAEHSGLKIVQMIPRRFETLGWDHTIRAERMRAAKHQDHNFSGWIVEFTK